MRILVLHAHPDPDSFNAVLYRQVVAGLRARGHAVDACDLYEEDFRPVMSRAERVGYHAIPDNRGPVEEHVRRLEQAEALLLVYPVWNFGLPAILKGYIDRVFLPGVSFKLVEGRVRPNLQHIGKLMVVTSYGGPRWRAFLIGDPPRTYATRVLRALIRPAGSMQYLAHYDMNRSTDATRAAFMARVEAALSGF
ncbi:MAG: NAD(P)H-dependent oxidoreductase [Hyphomicrobiales bacterium]|nr:NAD(P)H-dependent oxidoreductase [Hyphomicrobiales bacterium]